MSHLNVSSDEAKRLVKSVKWTEEYYLRMQALLGGRPEKPVIKSQPPVRAILLQNVYGGQDGLASLVGRDSINYGFMVEMVGINSHPTANTFKLRLTGYTDTPQSSTIVGTTGPISCLATQVDMETALLVLSPLLTADNVFVGLGNPYYDNDLILYGDVVPPLADTGDLAASYLGSWYISFNNSLFPFDSLFLDVVFDSTTTMNGLTKVTSRTTYDLLSPETTVVTDLHYRDSTYPWRVGTTVLCQDFDDVGYGIISGTFRNMVLS